MVGRLLRGVIGGRRLNGWMPSVCDGVIVAILYDRCYGPWLLRHIWQYLICRLVAADELAEGGVVDESARRDAQFIVELWLEHRLVIVIIHHIFPLFLTLLHSTDFGLDGVGPVLDCASCVVSDC